MPLNRRNHMSQNIGGIDLKYRPSTYFWASARGIALISDIKGAERRKLYQAALERGIDELLAPELTQHSLAHDDRQMQGRIHPASMGGEYLADCVSSEVEIARITIDSTTRDVTCIYARPVGKRIHYRVVDEYGGDTINGSGRRTSMRALNLVQLADFFLSNWDMFCCLNCNFSDDDYPRAEVHDFILDASSSFYAEFGILVHARIDQWLDEKMAERLESRK